jgi:hypothetical protein
MIPDNYQELVRNDFSGGLSLLRRPGETFVSYLKNLRPKADGTLQVRKGQSLSYTVGTGASGRILDLITYTDSIVGNHIYSIKEEDGTNDKVYDGATELTGITPSSPALYSSGVFKDTIFWSNGTDAIFYHVPGTGTIASITGTPTPPTGQFIYFYKARCYVAGLSTNDFYWSNARMFSTLPTCDFPALNSTSLGHSGTTFKGWGSYHDMLTLFADDSYFVMLGTPYDDGALGDMKWMTFPGLGCASSRSIAEWPRGIIFLGNDRKLYSLEQTSAIELDPFGLISPYLEAVNSSILDYVSAVYFNGEVWIYVPKGADKDIGRVLIYNTAMQNWTVFEDIDGYTWGKMDGKGRLFCGSAAGGYIWEQNTTKQDLGSKINIEFQSRPELLGSVRKVKTLNNVAVQLEILAGDSVNVSYRADNDGLYTAFNTNTPITSNIGNWGNDNWGVRSWEPKGFLSKILRFANGVELRAREFVLKLAGTATGGSTIHSYSVVSKQEEREGEVI